MKAKTVKENGFKETEIGLIPSDWDIDKLGKCCEVFSGYAFKSSDFAEKGVLIVKIGNLQDGTIVVDKRTNYYPKEIDESLEKFVLKREDALIALTGATTGKIAVVPKKFEGSLLNQRVGKFNIFDKKLDNSFFRFFSITSRFQDDIKGNILKSAQGNVSPKKIEQLTIILPTFPEQQKIAAVLSKIQQAIEQQDKIIQITKELKKSLMNKLFTEGLSGEQQKETEIGLIPKNWITIQAKDVTKITSGGTPRRDEKKYFNGNIYWVKSGELEDNILYGTEEKITNEALQNSSAKPFPVGTVLIAMYGATVGKTGLLGVEATTNQAICAILPNEKKFVPEFLRHYFILIRDKLLNQRYGGAQPNISQTIIKNTLIPLPKIEEQKEIANILSNIDKKLSQAESKKQTLQAFFKTMLNQLMTGRVRVKNLDIEVN